ncbi:type I-C CRISPR-associated protein Cas7/Csd2 [Rosistilla oblonga]|uniref:type I-C CRISPR-associated protein Cas7/Csd2 n=1 Tax=Rosistilla oblonga TaxID=2527990 RepID=UPI003A9760EE
MNQPIENRYEFLYLFDCENGNPNGDPDAGNAPRVDYQDMHGLVSDVMVKRRIRNYVQTATGNAMPNAIFIEHASNLNEAIARSAEATQEVKNAQKKDSKEKSSDANKRIVGARSKWMCDNFYDVRTFGAVMSTGPNAGQVRGPVQIAFSRSVDPIVTMDVAITRMAVAGGPTKANATAEEYAQWTESQDEDKLRTMGRKSIIPYGLYVGKGFISANLAEKTGFTVADLKLLFEAVLNMFEHDRSSSKGVMTVRAPIFVFKHVGTGGEEQQRKRQAKMGCCPAQTLFEDVVDIKQNAEDMSKDGVNVPRKWSHYSVAADESKVPAGVELIQIKSVADLEKL